MIPSNIMESENQKQVKPETADILPPDFCASLNLSVRATNVVNRMRMELRSYDDFLSLNRNILRGRRNCGKKTIAEILSAVEKFRAQNRTCLPKPDFTSPISYLELSMDTAKAVRNLGITSIYKLARISEEQLLKSNVTPQNLMEIWAKLYAFLKASESASALFTDTNTVDCLRLSVRATNGIKALNITKVDELAKVSDVELLNKKNIGKKSLYEVRMKLHKYCVAKGWFGGKAEPGRIGFPKNLRLFLEKLLLELPQKEREILISRFGLWNAEIKTLEVLADSHGCTRERIRQIESKALEHLRWSGNVKLIRQLLDLLHRKYFRPILKKGYGLATEDELEGVFLSLFASLQEGMCAERFVSETFLQNRTIYEGCCLKVQDGLFALDDKFQGQYLNVIDCIRNHLACVNKPLQISSLISLVMHQMPKAFEGRMARRSIARFIEVSPDLSSDTNGLCGLAKWGYMQPKNLHDRIVRTLMDIGKPAHFTQIAMQLNEKFARERSFSPRNIQARLICDQETFVWQANGVYGLSAWGLTKAPYVKDRLEQILQSSGRPMSLDQIIPKVLETCRCKENSVGVILDSNPDLFLKYDTRIYGLKQWVSDKVELL
jgi:DNA-directed RNA polymerase alpha subunit